MDGFVKKQPLAAFVWLMVCVGRGLLVALVPLALLALAAEAADVGEAAGATDFGEAAAEIPLADSSIRFLNFNKPLTLKPLQGLDYQLEPGSQKVRISDRLLVATRQPQWLQSLSIREPEVLSATPLYQGHIQYWQLQLSSVGLLQAWLDRLKDEPAVLHVQPDLLQLGGKRLQNKTNALPGDAPPATEMRRLALELGLKGDGKGATIAVIDDGFDLSHPQLADLKTEFEFDIASRTTDARPRAITERHGTAIAGVLFGKRDGIAPDGIVPAASLIAIRQPDSWTSNTLLAFQLAHLAGADVINCSWTSPMLLQPITDVVDDLARHGRDGLGMPVVFAAGNQGRLITGYSTEAAIAEALVVGAAGPDGRRLRFSNHGPTVDFYAPALKTTTTAPNHDYASFSGTSFAAALTSGLIAQLIANDASQTLAQLQQQLQTLWPGPSKE